MSARTFHVYVLASRTRRLYVGMPSDLPRRLARHHLGLVPGFTRRSGIATHVLGEPFEEPVQRSRASGNRSARRDGESRD